MRWRRLGLVVRPNGSWWSRTHAYLPTAEVLPGGKTIRVYYSGWDEHKRGRIGFADLDSTNPQHLLRQTSEPILELGEPGCFDDRGVIPSCVLTRGGQKYMYYIGFQLTQTVPYMIFSGIARFIDNGTRLERLGRVPVLDRTDPEPFSRSAPFVLHDGSHFRMWYWNCLYWTVQGGRAHYNNVIRHMASDDMHSWPQVGEDAIVPDFETEYAAGRPWVMRRNDGWHMWYSMRAHDKPYVIQYAYSEDGRSWHRNECGLDLGVSEEGFDDEMTCFASVVEAAGHTYMFYNGNNHGREGVACAVLEA